MIFKRNSKESPNRKSKDGVMMTKIFRKNQLPTFYGRDVAEPRIRDSNSLSRRQLRARIYGGMVDWP